MVASMYDVGQKWEKSKTGDDRQDDGRPDPPEGITPSGEVFDREPMRSKNV
jgi:hypothetical protein